MIKGLPCWPSEPLYDQLIEGDSLREQGINLESFWTPWEDVRQMTLVHGDDFDEVHLGIAWTARDMRSICAAVSSIR